MVNGNSFIGVFCDECKAHTLKKVRYLRGRIRKGKRLFYCSRKCASAAHSKAMAGKANPNYGGTFRGISMSQRSAEERKAIGKKISATMIRKGVSSGSNNGRWAGGKVEHACVICGRLSEKSPYKHRDILRGVLSPTCSTDCSLVLGRRKIPFEDTSIELAIERELVEAGITFVKQFNLNDKFRPDFVLPEHSIIIECDGDYWHTLPEVVRRDKRKNTYYAACGYKLFRFWGSEIEKDANGCILEVLEYIQSQ